MLGGNLLVCDDNTRDGTDDNNNHPHHQTAHSFAVVRLLPLVTRSDS